MVDQQGCSRDIGGKRRERQCEKVKQTHRLSTDYNCMHFASNHLKGGKKSENKSYSRYSVQMLSAVVMYFKSIFVVFVVDLLTSQQSKNQKL